MSYKLDILLDYFSCLQLSLYSHACLENAVLWKSELNAWYLSMTFKL